MIAKPQLRIRKISDSRQHIEYLKPENIVKCNSKAELEKILEWYSYPFIKHRLPDDPHARRRYVEKVRPALRFMCKKFGVNIPSWLEGNRHYDQMSPEDHEAFFGSEPLNVREFEEMEIAEGDGASPNG